MTALVVYGADRTLAEAPPRRRPIRPLALAVAALVALAATVGVARAEAPPQIERWRPLVSQYADWSPDVALAVIACESNGDPAIPNRQGSGALGLFQVMGRWRPLAFDLTGSSDLADPAVNVATAHALYGWFGWSPWASSKACWAGGW